MIAGPLPDFVWRHLERKLAQSGATGAGPTDLRRLVSIDRLPLPEDGSGDEPPSERLVRFELSFRHGEVNVELNARDAAPMSWVFEKLADGPGPQPAPADALTVATAAAELPPGAVLAHADYEEIGGRPVFVCQWEHREDGVLVERDYIRVLVSGQSGRVFAVHRRWHAVNLAASER
jgi:hypothetical protein